MMETNNFKFLGFKERQYVFINSNGLQTNFSKCRKDLIEDFKLDDDKSIGEWFKVSFFQTKPLNKNDLGNEVFIISNMEIMK